MKTSSACCPKGRPSTRSFLRSFIILLIASIMLLPVNVAAQCTLSAIAAGSNTPCGQCTGSATVVPTGGAEPYTYIWSTGATTQSIGQAAGGTSKFIDCGDTVLHFTTTNGDVFLKDQNYSGGTIFSNNIAIAGTDDDGLFQNEHFVGNSGFFSYNIPVTNGSYTVDLYFAEIFFGTPGKSGGAGSRKFDVSIEGALILDDYDVFVDAGGAAIAIIKTFNTTVNDGSLTILFKGVVNNAKVNAIAVRPAHSNGLCPGTYTVTVSDANHCQTVASTTILGTGCNDNSLCTTDQCINNACTYTAIDCNDNDACTDDACAAETGCQHTARSCDDNDLCTDDACDTGAGCQHTTINCNDDNLCTDDACEAETGCQYAIHDCKDNDLCTDDFCDAIAGCHYAPHNCADGSLCTDDFCTAEIGCYYENHDCDDNDGCTSDVCDAGTGCSHQPKNCADDDGCTEDGCLDGICTHTEIPGCNDPCKDVVCNDEDPCTSDACNGEGDCVYTAMVCTDADLCTQDECIDGICFNIPDNCDDGDACTGDICLGSGTCDNPDINCDDSDACTTDDCDNGCTHTAVICDDHNSCTENACADGLCVYTPINCDDNNDCTEDACDAGDCKHSDVICTDSDNCTDDACIDGHCAFTPINCSDENSCTDDFCEDGLCFSTNIECNDNDNCTSDGCQDGACVYIQQDCDDEIACTIDACNDGICSNTAKVCEDNNICTNDACENGQCIYTPNPCDDSNPCTVDGCSTDCTHTPKDCSDNNDCTTDACDNGRCIHTDISCDDEDACTTDGCNNGCTHTAIVCTDNSICTTDACVNGVCNYTPINCDDGNACTTDGCNNGCTHINTCNPCTLEVTSFTLINSTTDLAIGTLESGAVINLFYTPNINVKANLCQEPIGSVKFNLNGPTHRIESTAPYAVAGDASGDYNKWNIAVGSYTLKAIPFTGAGATGTQGIAKTITFTVINQQAGCTTGADCSDNNACTNDDCVNSTCTHTPIVCNDENACTADACSDGCKYTVIDCNDNNACTTDACDASTGCSHTPVADCCNSASDCNDGDVCTTDACNEQHQCTHTATASGAAYLHVVNTSKNWKKLKLGYSSTSLFTPKYNVTAGGNNQLCITLRGTANTEWSKLQIRPQGSVSAPVSLGGYGLGTSFTEICIPLSAFGAGVDFTKLSLIEIPYSNGAGAFEIDIQKIEFRGGATPFLWFGDSKTDNFHDGNTATALTATLVAGGPCGSASKRENHATETDPVVETTTLFAYPNPFSDRLNIEFTIATDSDVKLEIYNITGQRLATLFEGNMTSGQTQKFEYTPESTADGMYIYRLQTNQGIYFGKAVLQK